MKSCIEQLIKTTIFVCEFFGGFCLLGFLVCNHRMLDPWQGLGAGEGGRGVGEGVGKSNSLPSLPSV